MGDLPDETKLALRAELLAARRARSDDAREQARDRVVRAVVAALDPGWRCVAAYLPMRTEPGSVALLAELSERGLRVLVPQVLPDNDLDWAAWPGSAPLGVGALAQADLVLVPALAVSVSGVRLGRGGGSYDRALGRVRAGVPVVALLFDGEIRDALPCDPWDRPVTDAVTPSGWVRLQG